MAELDVAQASSPGSDDAERRVSESVPTPSQDERLSDEQITLRPPAGIDLLLDDAAPDTVRRRIDPPPDAIGGSRRESGVQAVTSRADDDASTGSLEAESAPPVAAAEASAPPAADGAEPVASALPGSPEDLASEGSSALGEPAVPSPAGDASLDAAAVTEEPTSDADEASEAVAQPADAEAVALDASTEPSAQVADEGDFAREVSVGWIEAGAEGEPIAGEAMPSAADDEAAELGEEVQASWIEQGGELDEALTADASTKGLASDSAEVTAGWIEEGERGERATPQVPTPPGRREPSQPWIDEEADPVTPHDRGRSAPTQTADLPLAEELRGRVLANRFLAEEITEQSAASITYSAYHLALDSPVMIQVLPRGLACFGEACELVRRTAVAASMIGSAHIARTLDFGVFGGGWPYWVAEYVDGKSLARLLGEEGKLGLRRVLALAKQLAAGLAAAHAAGIVHGHLKPDCLIVVEPGTRAESVRILGFGLLHAAGDQPTPPSSGVYGVPFYVSPEQAACRPCDERTDLYALGAVLYELMTGRPPFTGGDFAAVLCQHLDDDAEPPSALLDLTTAIARGLDEVVLRCLAKDPEQRYASAAELADALVSLEQSLGTGKRRPMPEIARPTATIHSPAPRADSSLPPEPKVIVSADLEAEALTPALPIAGTVGELSSEDETPALGTPVQPVSGEHDAIEGSSAPSGEVAPDEGDGSGWWGRLIGRVSGAVRRPS
jgi:serine/threonine protein kinase